MNSCTMHPEQTYQPIEQKIITPNKLEIEHFAGVDFITDKLEVHPTELTELDKRGIVSLIQSHIKSEPDEEVHSPYPFMGPHKFYIKEKFNLALHQIFTRNSNSIHGESDPMPTMESIIAEKGDRQAVAAYNSVVNELQITRVVAEALADEKFQTQIRGLGFLSLELVKPVAGIVFKEEARKFIVLPYIAHDDILIEIIERYKGRGLSERALEAVNITRDTIEDLGIEPDELYDQQVLYKRERTGARLYLVDTESYYWKTKLTPKGHA
jgi:hypothetical protein